MSHRAALSKYRRHRLIDQAEELKTADEADISLNNTYNDVSCSECVPVKAMCFSRADASKFVELIGNLKEVDSDKNPANCLGASLDQFECLIGQDSILNNLYKLNIAFTKQWLTSFYLCNSIILEMTFGSFHCTLNTIHFNNDISYINGIYHFTKMALKKHSKSIKWNWHLMNPIYESKEDIINKNPIIDKKILTTGVIERGALQNGKFSKLANLLHIYNNSDNKYSILTIGYTLDETPSEYLLSAVFAFLLFHSKISIIEIPIYFQTHYSSLLSLMCLIAETSHMWKCPWDNKIYLILSKKKKTIRLFNYRILITMSKYMSDKKIEDLPSVFSKEFMSNIKIKDHQLKLLKEFQNLENNILSEKKYINYFIENVT
jgi:hypothetical protein